MQKTGLKDHEYITEPCKFGFAALPLEGKVALPAKCGLEILWKYNKVRKNKIK